MVTPTSNPSKINGSHTKVLASSLTYSALNTDLLFSSRTKTVEESEKPEEQTEESKKTEEEQKAKEQEGKNYFR